MTDRPSTYTPFLRRFFGDDERTRELRAVEDLYARVKAHQDAFADTAEEIFYSVWPCFEDAAPTVRERIGGAIFNLIHAESQIWELPPPDFERMTLQEFVEYRSLLHQKLHFFANQDEHTRLLREGLREAVGLIGQALPGADDASPFTIPYVYALDDPKRNMDLLILTFCSDQYQERGLFTDIAETLWRNVCIVSGRNPDDRTGKGLVFPGSSSLPLDKVVEQYLAGTPFQSVFEAPVPLRLTNEDRFGHMHVLGGTGAGKTTLMENLILHDLLSDDPPSVVLIDPHGDLIRKLTHADLGIADRLVIIDPRDIENPPALNVFALNQERMKGYDAAMREQVTASVIQTFDYLFQGILGADLTAKQDVFFRYIARLMLSLPETMGRNATILDMMELMIDPVPYGAAIGNLPDIPREFFMRDFVGKGFQQTRDQIRYRLQAILENPTLARLFTSPETKVDIFSELNRGSIILVDTAKDFLKDGSAAFGRIFISLTLQAVLERAAIKERDRKPTFLYIDEAATYFDSNIDDFLNEARKYKCGIILSHQYLGQAPSSLRSSLAANTSIKFASGLSAADATVLAREMRTTADFILGQPRLQFAAYIRNVTPQAVSIPIQPVTELPQLNDEDYLVLMAGNREKVSLPPEARRVSSRPSEAAWPEEKSAKRQQKRRSAEDVSEGW